MSRIEYDDLISMNLEEIIINPLKIQHFINHDLKRTVVNEDNMLDHPLRPRRLNMGLKNTDTPYKLLDLQIYDVFCYYQSSDKFALYLTLNVRFKQDTDKLITLFGKPWNVQSWAYESGDFDMLLWEKDGYQISITNLFEPLQPALKLLNITNLPLEELYLIRN